MPLDRERERRFRLAALKQSESWGELREFYEERLRKDCETLGRQLIAGTSPADQRVIDFKRGFWAGIRAILDTPEAAERALERELSNGGDEG